MSSHSKDPNEKQDTPSESGEPQSESDLSETEDHLEHLEIAERAAKKKAKVNVVEIHMLDSPNQEDSLANQEVPLDEPIAGPSGLKNPHLSDSESLSEAKDACLQDRNNENIQEEIADEQNVEEIAENIDAEREDENQDQSLNSHPAGDSGHVSVHYIASRTDPPVARRRGHERETDEVGFPDDLPYSSSSIRTLPSTDSAHSSVDTCDLPDSLTETTDSANTFEGISDIHSEVVCMSTGGSAYYDAQENVRVVDPPSVYVSAVETQNSESSDTTASDLPEDSASRSTNASISTNTGEEGNQAYLARLQEEADKRGVPISTSSGVASTNQSDLAHLQHWGRIGEMGNRPNINVADPIQEVSEHSALGEIPQPVSDHMEDEPILESTSKQKKAIGKGEVCRLQGAKGGPIVRRKSAKCYSDSDSAENAPKSRPRIKPVTMKSKLVAIKSSVVSEINSESPIPKSSSSEELNRSESSEMTSTSENSPRSKKDKKSWQMPGQLRSMQHSTVTTKDVNMTEGQSSPLLSPDPALQMCVAEDFQNQKNESPEKMETTPEKMEATVEKPVEDVTATDSTEPMSPTQEPGDQVFVYEVDEDELSFELSDSERSGWQTKRPGGRLSTSPPSDGRLSSTPPKDSPVRPKKKARDDKKQGKSRRSRTDSESSLSGSVGLDILEEENPTCTPGQSDYEEDGRRKTAQLPETSCTK